MPRSPSSTRIIRNSHAASTHAFLPPLFQPPQPIAERDIVPLMNAGKYTFVVDIPPKFRARRARRTPPGNSGRCRRDRDGAGRSRVGLRTADHYDRNQRLPLQHRRRSPVAGQSGGAHRLQPQCDDRVVHQRDGDHQQRHHACHHHVGGGHHPGTRARHDGPSAGHAADAVRDRHVQGLGEWPGDHRGGRPFALRRRAHDPRHSHSPARYRCSWSAW